MTLLDIPVETGDETVFLEQDESLFGSDALHSGNRIPETLGTTSGMRDREAGMCRITRPDGVQFDLLVGGNDSDQRKVLKVLQEFSSVFSEELPSCKSKLRSYSIEVNMEKWAVPQKKAKFAYADYS